MLLPETTWILSAFPRLRRRDRGEVILLLGAITEIWPFTLSPQPKRLLFSVKAKKEHGPEYI